MYKRKEVIGNITLYLGDCLEVIPSLDIVNCVITDPPYGITSCKWDSVIPFDIMWSSLNKITTPSTPIILFGSEPFSSNLRMSNTKYYKYDWLWKKERPTGFANAKKQPLRTFENIMVFYKKQPTYNPQNITPINKLRKNTRSVGGNSLRKEIEQTLNKGSLRTPNKQYIQEFTNYPKNILSFPSDKDKLHPTQKPTPLLEYLINTYTNEEETILDFTMGSGTTLVACLNTNRKGIGIELDETYFDIACKRVEQTLLKNNP